MATTLKKCFKLHKLFVAEVARSARLESEGAQVLSSLANVSQRLPTLLQHYSDKVNEDNDVDDNAEVMGVLSYSINTQALLLQKHFLALEKSRGFLAGILNDYQEVLRHLRSFTSDCVALVADALIEGENAVNAEDEMAAVAFPLQLQEWMETVLAMFEHEVFRKTRLVAGLEYSNTLRLSTVAKQWSVKGAKSNINDNYGTLNVEWWLCVFQ
ncbi:hypothetical protein V7S43_015896 [Phytophthora oleae]|uniref:Uncharacterized protein n=1 Tax=Phytophthora oleae TaxID=2107226 RepID=A0ABD3EWV3_9STRA